MIDKENKNNRIEKKKEKKLSTKYLNTSKDHAIDRSVTCELRISSQEVTEDKKCGGKAGLNPQICGPVVESTETKELQLAVADLLMAMMDVKRIQIASVNMPDHTDGSSEESCTGSGDNADATRSL